MGQVVVGRQPNPYRPGFNQAPAVLAGRDVEVDAVREALSVAALDGRTPRPLVLEGPRGVGKTVLLGRAAELAAEEFSWPTVQVEVKPGGLMLAELVERLAGLVQALSGRAAQRQPRTRVSGGKVSAGAFGVEAEVSVERVARPGPVFALDAVLVEVMAALAPTGAGLVLTVDEAQQADREEMGQLAATLQEHVPHGWPLVVVVAGLPSLRGTARSRPPTYLERGEWLQVGFLGLADARAGLVGPARDADRPMSTEAVDRLLGVAGGYPYAIQVAGHHAWRASSGAPAITGEHAAAAMAGIDRDLGGLFRSRWADASGREQDYLQAVAQLTSTGGRVSGRAVADALGASTREVSYLRERLIHNGTLYAQDDHSIRFITPGMSDWIQHTHPATDQDPPGTDSTAR